MPGPTRTTAAQGAIPTGEADVGAGEVGTEFIDSFTRGEDLIDLRATDADPTLRGDQAFEFVPRFAGRAGQVTFRAGERSTGEYSAVRADLNGDRRADLELTFFGDAYLIPRLSAEDFIL